jgi:hypothetical protein
MLFLSFKSSIEESYDFYQLRPENCLFLGVIGPSSSWTEWILLLILFSISVTPMVISRSRYSKVELLRLLGEGGEGLLYCFEAGGISCVIVLRGPLVFIGE